MDEEGVARGGEDMTTDASSKGDMDTIVTTMGLTGVVPGLTDMDMDTGSVFMPRRRSSTPRRRRRGSVSFSRPSLFILNGNCITAVAHRSICIALKGLQEQCSYA